MQDFGSNGIDVTTYRIVDGNSDNLFSLFILPQDRHYLYLGLNRSLDREIFDQYALKIGVRDGGNPTREGFLTVQVTYTVNAVILLLKHCKFNKNVINITSGPS